MLVLTRRQSESIIIGDNVTVTVLSIKGNQVRLGVEAPKDIRVDRDEIRNHPDFDPDHKPKDGRW